MKVLLFDSDRSTSAIGSAATIKETFGFEPVTINGGVDQVDALIERLCERKTEESRHELFGATGAKDTYLVFNEKARQMGLGAIVIDSLSVVGYQTRLALMAANKMPSMDLQLWGQYGEKLIRFIHKLSRLDAVVVCTAHLDRDKDEEGGPIEMPAFKGAAKMEAARFFDVIIYTKVTHGRKNEREYSWHIVPSNRRSQAKSRLPYPSETGVIPQDLSKIIEFYRENGIPNPKIMIIGDSGSGKTTSLKTLLTQPQEETTN